MRTKTKKLLETFGLDVQDFAYVSRDELQGYAGIGTIADIENALESLGLRLGLYGNFPIPAIAEYKRTHPDGNGPENYEVEAEEFGKEAARVQKLLHIVEGSITSRWNVHFFTLDNRLKALFDSVHRLEERINEICGYLEAQN